MAQLGNIISMLVGFFGSRAAEKRSASRGRFELKHQEAEARKPGGMPDLHQEIAFLHRLNQKQEARIRMEELAKSVMGLIVFWVVGAAIFNKLEVLYTFLLPMFRC